MENGPTPDTAAFIQKVEEVKLKIVPSCVPVLKFNENFNCCWLLPYLFFLFLKIVFGWYDDGLITRYGNLQFGNILYKLYVDWLSDN